MICNIKNLRVNVRKDSILIHKLSYSIYKSDFIVILGSNGSGKTTLLKAISGDMQYSGNVQLMNKIEIKNTSRSILSKHIGIITQNAADSLFMDFSLMENFYMYMHGLNKRNQDFDEFCILLESINSKLLRVFKSKIWTLSGGERQCFLLALNLFFKRDLLLLDEHTSALDPKTAAEVMQITAEKIANTNITCIMTTHSLDDAIQYGNRLLAMQSGAIIKSFDVIDKQKLSKSDLLQYCY